MNVQDRPWSGWCETDWGEHRTLKLKLIDLNDAEVKFWIFELIAEHIHILYIYLSNQHVSFSSWSIQLGYLLILSKEHK